MNRRNEVIKKEKNEAMQKEAIRQKRIHQIRTQIPFWVMMIIPLAFFAIFCYFPMFGLLIAFQDYKIGSPFIGVNVEWVGLKWFERIFDSPMLWRRVRNTFLISFYDLLLGFPLTVGLALLLNEIQWKRLKKFASTVSILPHFISTVVVVGMLTNMFSVSDGVVNNIIESLGGEKINFLGSLDWFRTVYIGSGIWQGMGFSAVVYTAAIAGIDPGLYEAAALDGSTRLKNMYYITIPCIAPTIVIMLILRMGNLLSVGSEKMLLMYSPAVYEVGDVLSTYVYREGVLGGQTSLTTAVGLVNSTVNLAFLGIANLISRKCSETSLW